MQLIVRCTFLLFSLFPPLRLEDSSNIDSRCNERRVKEESFVKKKICPLLVYFLIVFSSPLLLFGRLQ